MGRGIAAFIIILAGGIVGTVLHPVWGVLIEIALATGFIVAAIYNSRKTEGPKEDAPSPDPGA